MGGIMISLVAFLGNYGKQYAGNRHNVAWQFADSLPFASSLSWQKKFKGQYASRALDLPNGERRLVHFLKPETFMNLSGESIGDACAFFKIKSEEVLVIHDELELPLGTVSLKWSGGLGGHNGLRSTKTVLGTPDFWRLRFGIGRPDHPDVAAFVLSDFGSDERIALSLVWPEAAKLLALVMEKGAEPFLKEWAKKKITD
jgi:PTH1 family peptidyl-tRNA hydrolase